MRNLLLSGLLLLAVFLAGQVRLSAAPIVTNGDFSANPGDFTNYPGYGGSGNGHIADWASNVTGYEPGINSYQQGLQNAFSPSGYSSSVATDPEYFAFLQYVYTPPTLSQTISLTAGATYKLSFVSAPRQGDGATNTGAGIDIRNSSLGLTLAAQTYFTAPAYTGSGNFQLQTFTFTALGRGTSTIILAGPTGVTANDIYPTEDFSDISITELTTPEPASYALVGLGLLSVLIFSRRLRSVR